MLLAFAACNTNVPSGLGTQDDTEALDILWVESLDVVRDGRQLLYTVRFSQPVSDAALQQAVRVLEVHGHLVDGRSPGTEIPVESVTGQDYAWTVRAGPVREDQSYVLEIASSMQSLDGQKLDGAAGPISGSAGRLDDDFYEGPLDLISLPVGPWEGTISHTMRTHNDRPALRNLRLYRSPTGSSYSEFFRQPFASHPVDRAPILPAVELVDLAYRISFTGASYYESLMDPASLVEQIRFIDNIGGAFTPVFSYNASLGSPLAPGGSLKVTDVIVDSEGIWYVLEEQLADAWIGTNLFVNEGDVLRMYVGDDDFGTAAMPKLTAYDTKRNAFRVNADAGRARITEVRPDGTLGLANPLIPAGMFSGALTAMVGEDVFDVAAADRDTVRLAAPVTAGVAGMDLALFFSAVSEPALPVSVFLLADYVYLFTNSVLLFGRPYVLTLGLDQVPRNLFGIPMTDRLRDGDERRNTGRDDRIELPLSILQNAAHPVPQNLILNDGAYYPRTADELELNCASTVGPLCVVPGTESCAADTLYFSFATPDGIKSNPKGSSDLVRTANVKTQPVILFRDSSGGDSGAVYDQEVPVQWTVDTVMAPGNTERNFSGGPTSLFRVQIVEPCQSFRLGDQLVIQHSVSAEFGDSAVFFDGNGNGLQENGALEDYVRWYAGSPTGFVTLEEFVQKDIP